MEFVGHGGSLSAKETEDVEGICPISKKAKCPRDVDVEGSSPISKKAKCPGDVGGPSFTVAYVADRIAAAEDAAAAATTAYIRIPMTLLAEYLELRSITKKHILEIQSDKAEVSRSEGLLVEIESKIGGISRSLREKQFLRVYTVSEAKAVHYLMSDQAWVGEALIYDEEVGPELKDVSEAVKQHNIPHHHLVRSKYKSKSKV